MSVLETDLEHQIERPVLELTEDGRQLLMQGQLEAALTKFRGCEIGPQTLFAIECATRKLMDEWQCQLPYKMKAEFHIEHGHRPKIVGEIVYGWGYSTNFRKLTINIS